MLFDFKHHQVSRIKCGSMTATIRLYRKDGKLPKLGETFLLYTGLRTKSAQKIGTGICASVGNVRITKDRFTIDDTLIAGDEREVLAAQLGFDTYEKFERFWLQFMRLPF